MRTHDDMESLANPTTATQCHGDESHQEDVADPLMVMLSPYRGHKPITGKHGRMNFTMLRPPKLTCHNGNINLALGL